MHVAEAVDRQGNAHIERLHRRRIKQKLQQLIVDSDRAQSEGLPPPICSVQTPRWIVDLRATRVEMVVLEMKQPLSRVRHAHRSHRMLRACSRY